MSLEQYHDFVAFHNNQNPLDNMPELLDVAFTSRQIKR